MSRGGGVQPVWQHDGRELIYRQGSRVMSVRLTTSPAFQSSAPVTLFTMVPRDQLLDVMPDGRLLVLRRDELSVTTSLQLVVNWFEELKARR